ncbi:MAG: hypothetical protein RIR26_1595 [Pseudomonadota bacterium]
MLAFIWAVSVGVCEDKFFLDGRTLDTGTALPLKFKNKGASVLMELTGGSRMAINNVKPQNSPSTNAPLAQKTTTDAGKTEGVQATKMAANAYAKSAQPQAQQAAANVQISPRARELNMARQVVDATPDVREDKVAKFKAMIERGEYKPDSGKIADGILAEAIRDELSKSPEVALS